MNEASKERAKKNYEQIILADSSKLSYFEQPLLMQGFADGFIAGIAAASQTNAQMWFYCDQCGTHSAKPEEPHQDEMNPLPWADVVCETCRLVVNSYVVRKPDTPVNQEKK